MQWWQQNEWCVATQMFEWNSQWVKQSRCKFAWIFEARKTQINSSVSFPNAQNHVKHHHLISKETTLRMRMMSIKFLWSWASSQSELSENVMSMWMKVLPTQLRGMQMLRSHPLMQKPNLIKIANGISATMLINIDLWISMKIFLVKLPARNYDAQTPFCWWVMPAIES